MNRSTIKEPTKGIEVIEHTIKVLNELLQADPKATNQLFAFGVPVNAQVCSHPTIQVRGKPKEPDEGVLGLLGLINGLVEEKNKVIVIRKDICGTSIDEFVVGTLEYGKVHVS